MTYPTKAIALRVKKRMAEITEEIEEGHPGEMAVEQFVREEAEESIGWELLTEGLDELRAAGVTDTVRVTPLGMVGKAGELLSGKCERCGERFHYRRWLAPHGTLVPHVICSWCADDLVAEECPS